MMRLTIHPLALAIFTAKTFASPCSCGYTVNATTSPSHAVFTQILETDFLHTTALPSDGDWLPQIYNVTPSSSHGPYGKIALDSNVLPNAIPDPNTWSGEGKGLELWVRSAPFQNTMMIPMAEIVASRSDILYGSFRIALRTTAINGTCAAFFTYFSDSSEIDLEFLSLQPNALNLVIQSPESAATGYVNPGSPDFINQVLSFATAGGYHEYRFDWLPDRVEFFVDGKLARTIRDNVPNAAGRLHVSHWSNGNEGWSGGPPAQDARLVVSYVKAYFNSSTGTGDCQEGDTCEIPNQLTPPDPGGPNGNSTGRTFFFLGPENTTDSGGKDGNAAKGGAARLMMNMEPTVACSLLMLVAAMMFWGA